MGKKLFRVSIELETEVYVMAEDREKAERIAKTEADIDSWDYEYMAREVSKGDGVSGDWYDEQPHGIDDDDFRTCAEIAQGIAPEDAEGADHQCPRCGIEGIVTQKSTHGKPWWYCSNCREEVVREVIVNALAKADGEGAV